MHSDTINSVLVVGGGTAGWLTAAKLAKSFNSLDGNSIQVCLIESPDIPTIGVGEGTWPTMRATLASLGIDEAEFLRTCHGTFKQGTKFINWQNASRPNQYHHLFTSIFDPTQFNLAPYWLQGDAGDLPYAQAVSAQARIAELGLAPKKITSKAYEGIQNYAYHLDAGKFAELLKSHAIDKLGVKFIAANVTDVSLDAEGYIEAVVTDTWGTVAADFFVDCSGFRSLLLGEALGVGFTSIADTLLTDHAVTIQVPYPDAAGPINACTHSTAQEAGWIWDIGLSNRRGVGYVYSSRHQSHEDAERTLRDYIGDAAAGLTARKLKIDLGYRNKFWHKNCVAIGLSAAFVEPLEASAIFLIEAAGNMLVDQLPSRRQGLIHAEKKFNASFHFRWQKTVDFIKMHYLLSGRSEAFWLDNREASSIPASLAQTLASWQQQVVSAYDFPHVYEPFPMESYQYVLYGMGFKPEQVNWQRYPLHAEAMAQFEKVQQVTEYLIKELPQQRDLLDRIYQYGFSTI
ncbi:tryptophan halogenase family protein [Shewanella salipaludis]|uniref:Tryptophan 7-halogenase n=1 Tax=Shewanella salipaludis TaxID=2723052 RepID=A0A972JM50_9GAMM|nr:tryptophan halogenase family protein [Shewanella salipaludis]NMH64731.1 tryptophan 7-halogenase [Shewanella salipaludis]